MQITESHLASLAVALCMLQQDQLICEHYPDAVIAPEAYVHNTAAAGSGASVFS